jgi:DNA-binding Lrp family transcriptional regulator
VPTAFVLVNAELGAEKNLVQSLRSIEGVTEVQVVYGVYDIVVKVETEDMLRMKDLIVSRIRQAYAAKVHERQDHIKTCSLCSAYFSGKVDIDKCTRDESIHIVKILRWQPQNQIRSTLTCVAVEGKGQQRFWSL